MSTAGTEAVEEVFDGSTTVVSELVCWVEGVGDDEDANRKDCNGIEAITRESWALRDRESRVGL